MTKPSGPIAIVCGYDASGYVKPAQLSASGYLQVEIANIVNVDASDVTYTPTTPADWDGGVDPGNQDYANDQLAERVKDLETAVVDIEYPHDIFLVAYSCRVITGAAISITITAAQAFNMQSFQNPGANGDILQFTAPLASGSYTLNLLGSKDTNRGTAKIQVRHQDTPTFTDIITGLDTYNASALYNQTLTGTFTIATEGLHIFRIVITGKHASSSGYYYVITSIQITRTTGES